MMEYPILNKTQTSIDDLNLDQKPKEVKEQFFDFFYNIPLIQNMTSPRRKRACDLERDEKGRIIVDITNPHILEDMDYFRPSAIHFQKTGKFTDLRPNPNKNSEFGKWIREEVRRCREGYVRKSDGEWIPGDLYFFWNYCPMSLAKKDDKGSRKSNRVLDFPRPWDGHYLKFHYLNKAREAGKHSLELASRQKGKSFSGAALLTKRFILGESKDVNKKVTCYATAAEKGYLVKGDQTLDKFQFNIDFIADNMEFPRKRLISSLNNMQWIMGYQNLDTGTKQGTLNAVMGVTSKDDESKLRGTRGVLYIIEEAGSFPRLLDLWGNMLPSVEDGEDVYGMLYAYGTSGDNQSDFYAMSEMMYHPDGYHVFSVENVFDVLGKGTKKFAFFFPGYLNYSGCYDDNGNSDITKAVLNILIDRYQIKHNSTDVNAVTKRTAEIPITPQEAIIRSRGNMFPVTQLNERLAQIESNPHFYDDVYVGELVLNTDNTVSFKSTSKDPIRRYPLKGDENKEGALEIFNMPEKDREGKVYRERYIIGHDPVDNDVADSESLTSTIVLDLWTDKIVAEYTGRKAYADDNFEVVRRLCIFYNAKCMYEQNKKGLFAYFSRFNSLHLLAETPEYLKDKQLIKSIGYGNQSRGVNATLAINNYANDRIRDWLLKPTPMMQKSDNEEVEVMMPNLMNIRNKALIQELIMFNPQINVDRVRALGMVMLYREEKMIIYQGNPSNTEDDYNYIGNDSFFSKNYDERISQKNLFG